MLSSVLHSARASAADIGNPRAIETKVAPGG